jgi:hypothetical protein
MNRRTVAAVGAAVLLLALSGTVAGLLVWERGAKEPEAKPSPPPATEATPTPPPTVAVEATPPLPARCVMVEGPLPARLPGDRAASDVSQTYPFLSTTDDLAGNGYVEEEFLLAGEADAFGRDGTLLATGVPYRTRIIVRRPAAESRFDGTVLAEWQNVTAGYDLDALWDRKGFMRAGYAWVGVSAQRVGVDFLKDWSPARYGTLDVTGGGRYTEDQLSYDIFAQAALVLREPRARCPGSADPLGGLRPATVLGIGASQSALRMVVYYDAVLPKARYRPFDGYAFVVGPAPSREGSEPIFHVLSETDVRAVPRRRDDSDTYRRWEVAGAAHAGYRGYAYRLPILQRDLPSGPASYQCERPPLSRVSLHLVLRAAYAHLVAWVREGTPPPHAPDILRDETGSVARNELGLALGGIQLSQVAVPTALNTGANSGPGFCILLGTHIPFEPQRLAELYPSRERYLALVEQVDRNNVRLGYLLPEDAADLLAEARESGVGGD